MPTPLAPSKYRSFDPLIDVVHAAAKQVPDTRGPNCTYSMPDAIMSAVSMFSLKDSSLLAFEERRNDQNLKNIFRINAVPSDTRMREILDPVEPEDVRPLFQTVLHQMQKSGALKRYKFHEGAYLISVDGTEYYSSKQVHCDQCLERKKRNGDEEDITYYHQTLAAVIMHPDKKQVLPLAPEAIVKQDGDNKNDCERNAATRLLEQVRRENPNKKFIVVEDALYSNAPHIRLLKRLRMSYIIGAKPADHEFLFEDVRKAFEEDRMSTVSWEDSERPGVTCRIAFCNNLPLNKSNQDVRVNFLQYSEYDATGKRLKHFTWVTDLEITEENAAKLVRAGRSRWKVENETFNTLKNQGYQFEHNFGHGKQNLSVVMSMLMMLAFLLDQIQEEGCSLFQAVLAKLGSRRSLWDHMRSHFRHFEFATMHNLYEVVLYDLARELPAPQLHGHYGSRVT